MAKRKLRALEKVEWPDGKGGYKVVNAGDEFDEPDEKYGIDSLIKNGAVEVVKK